MIDQLTTFDSTRESLPDLLRSVRAGKTQLPDFQRGWVWDDAHLASLLASVSQSYPIGAVMMLQTGNPEVRLSPRPLEGVSLPVPVAPERLVLDGQQRLTSLFQALFLDQPVETRDTRGKPIHRWYYLDIAKSLDPLADRDEAIVSVPEDRITRDFRRNVLADLSTPDKEREAGMLPLRLLFDVAGLNDWLMRYVHSGPGPSDERMATWTALSQNVIQRFQQYQIPLILLRKETPKEAVCQVFEKVNTGGVSLTVFELLTATFAADGLNLREDWAAREKQLRDSAVLHSFQNTDFLQAVALLATRDRRWKALDAGTPPERAPAISCKRREVLRLTIEEYRKWTDPLAKGLTRAAKFLWALRIFAARDIPYRTQLVPLSAILTVLGDRGDDDGVRSKLTRWYWCGVFGELYGGAIETRFARDLPEVLAWVAGGPEPSTIRDANFAPARLRAMRTRNSAAYKGLYALLMGNGGHDFRTGYGLDVQSYFDERIDIHHIFPQAWCRAQGIEPGRCDCVVNKTALSARTNRSVGKNAPSVYLGKLQRSADIEQARMDEILSSHLIDPPSLRADDFDAFFRARQQALLDLIARTMGTPLLADEDPEPEPAEYEDDQDAG